MKRIPLRRRLRFALVIIALNVVVLGVLMLVLLRVTDAYIERQRSTTLVYDIHALQRQILLPNQRYDRGGGIGFAINQYGMRGEAPKLPKSAGMLRIIVMGGSAVFDHLVTEGQSWPEQLADRLIEHGLENVESFNAGVPGYSSRETFASYHDRMRYFDPDVVVLYHGWNDAKYMKRFVKGVDVDAAFYVRKWREQYKFLTDPKPLRNWHALKLMWRDWRRGDGIAEGPAAARPKPTALDKLFAQRRKPPATTTPARRDAGGNVDWSSTPGMRFFEHNVDAFVHAVLSDGALPVLVAQNTLVTPDTPEAVRQKSIAYRYVKLDHDELVALNDAMADALRRIAAQYDIPFVDVRDKMNGRPNFFSDHVHMRPEGSGEFASLLAGALIDPIRAHRNRGRIE